MREKVKGAAERQVPMDKTQHPHQAMIVADMVPAMVWGSDTAALRTYFNRSWLEFTGRNLEQELGDGWVEGIHPQNKQPGLDTFRWSVRLRLPFKNGYLL